MPPLPKYRQRILPSVNVGAAPISTQAANVAGGAVGQGLAAIGRGVGDIGQTLLSIELEKQAGRDKISNSQASRDLDEWIASDIDRIESQRYDTVDELIQDRNGFGERYNSKTKEIKQNYNNNVAGLFEASANNNFASAQYHLGRRTFQKEQNMAASEWGRNSASLYQIMPPTTDPTYESWKKKFDDSRDAFSFYLDDHDLEAIEIQSLLNINRIDLASQKLAESKRLEPNEIAVFKSKINSARKQTDAVIEAQLNELNKEVVDTLTDDPENIGVINNLPTELKKAWEEKLVARDAWIKENPGSDPFINVNNPTIFNAFDTLLNASPSKLPESEIVNKIGIGLTLNDAQLLLDKKRAIEGTTKLRTSNPGFSKAYQRVVEAFEDDLIVHPEFVKGADVGSEAEKQNRIYTSGLLDQFTKWTEAKPRTHAELNKYIDELLAPHQELEARGFVGDIFHNLFSRESWVISAKEYRGAISSLNAEAVKEWEFIGAGERRHTFFGGALPEDFLHKWQSPHKIATPQIGAIYKKWAHGDQNKAEEMLLKDGWKIPQ